MSKKKATTCQHGCSCDLHQQEASQDLTGITTTPTEHICQAGTADASCYGVQLPEYLLLDNDLPEDAGH
jgi:hypothetical protein